MAGVTIQEVIAIAAEQARTRPEAITGPRRTAPLVRIRHRAMVVVKMLRPELSLTMIGRWFGGRDHSTVINALRKGALRVAQDPREAEAAEALWRAALIEHLHAQLRANRVIARTLEGQIEALEKAGAAASLLASAVPEFPEITEVRR
ncbi:MAG: hypothetical protein KIS81_00745 [Maricaulaceae bacterium]|nr:hypothetical protein [Maricaulaceae bacterium]